MKSLVLALSTAVAVVLTGCVNPDGSPNNTGTGALFGGAMGAFTGAVVGGANHGGPDALIGAAIGAVAGGLIGNAADREQEARLRAEAPPTYVRVEQSQPLSLADVKALARAGISEDVIINQIRNSRTIFHLSAEDIIDLRDAGATEKVINYMINTASTVGVAETTTETVSYIAEPPPPPPVETVVVAPSPGDVWVGGEWVWNGGWFWVAGHWCYPPHPHAVWIGGHCWHDAHGWHNERGHWG